MNVAFNPSFSEEKTLYPLNPTAYGFGYSYSFNACTFANLTSINASLSGEIFAACFRYMHYNTAVKYLSQPGDAIICDHEESLRLTQIRWSDLGLNTPVKIIAGSMTCPAVNTKPSLFPNELDEEKTFTLGLPSGSIQTFPINPNVAEVKKEALDFRHKALGKDHLCQKLSLLHQGKDTKPLSISCLTKSYHTGNSYGKLYTPQKLTSEAPVFYCKPENDNSDSEIIFNFYFNTNFPREEDTDTSIVFKYKLANCSEIKVPPSLNSSSKHLANNGLIALTAFITVFLSLI